MNDIYILDKNFNTIAVFDYYKSLIWSNRYYKTGDFELQIPFNAETKEKIKQNYYIYRSSDYNGGIIERPKLIEKIELIDNISEYSLLVSGRDVSALLERRIIYPTETLSGMIETCIYSLLKKHIMSPSDTNRTIDSIIGVDTGLIQEKIEEQITGDTLLEYIENVCNDFKVGFRMDFDCKLNKFVFKLYDGVNRTATVEICKDFDNLIKYDYVSDIAEYKNMAYALGYGEGADRKLVKLNDDKVGLDRYELYVDARDLTETDSDGNTIEESKYMEQLRQRGSEKLSEKQINITNSCEIEPNTSFIFNKDYFLGDLITCKSYETFAERIVETTESSTATGIKTELTFEEVE